MRFVAGRFEVIITDPCISHLCNAELEYSWGGSKVGVESAALCCLDLSLCALHTRQVLILESESRWVYQIYNHVSYIFNNIVNHCLNNVLKTQGFCFVKGLFKT